MIERDYSDLGGIPEQRNSRTPATIMRGSLPEGFPDKIWQEQQHRYRRYWDWWAGKPLQATTSPKQVGDTKKRKYPLNIDVVRDFARKRNHVLFGEASENNTPLVQASVAPRAPFSDPDGVKDEDDQLAQKLTSIINEIWDQSDGRERQLQNGLISQIVGGCVFQVCWVPDRDDMLIPIEIKLIVPDFFIPIADIDHNLLEVYIAYNISPDEARIKYGINSESDVLYVERWTPNEVTTFVGDRLIDQHSHDFGFVPFVYIPTVREANFYGPSFIDDIADLVLEYNSRLADLGDAVHLTTQRRRYVKNLHHNPKPVRLDANTLAIDLGKQPPHMKGAESEVWTEEPINVTPSMVELVKELRDQLRRNGSLAPIAYGEDEGSQRSALTLAFRMWPLTATAKAQRTSWTVGLNKIAKMIVRILIAKSSDPLVKAVGADLPEDTLKRVSIVQDWSPQIPRDREQMVQEIILRVQSGTLSPLTAIRMMGDVRNPQKELDQILDWKKQLSEFAGPMASAHDEQAPTDLEEPVASVGLEGE